MAGMIVSAKPPRTEDLKTSSIDVPVQTFAAAIDGLRPPHLGSNGWAIGKDRTENGRGM